MPDEAQHLTAAKPEPASAPAAKPAPDTPQAKNDTRGPVQRAQGAPVDKPEQPAVVQAFKPIDQFQGVAAKPRPAGGYRIPV